ncbi:MAG: branched-chain amino acid ABC transporter permease [Pseudolabrys sp.]|jgi:branched-chain amino acid transport system permease protein
MIGSLLIIQTLNGIQFGVMLFLLAAGLTLIFGIMNFINMMHGALYMAGAYVAATLYNKTGQFTLSLVMVVPITVVIGIVLEKLVFRHLYDRDHLDQVLCTYGFILIFNEIARSVWGASPYFMGMPDALSDTYEVLGVGYPVYRLLIVGAGLAIAIAAYILIHETRFGMLIRAGASDRAMVAGLGVNINLLNTMIFGIGAGLAGIAGALAAPILSVEPGMGEGVLILTVVVIVIGGIGSVRGAFFAALIVGVVDTVGRSMLPFVFEGFLSSSLAGAAGPAVASMIIYLLMALVLAFRPNGLFPVRGR